MANIVVLNSQAHRNLRVHAQASARLGDDQRFVTVVVGEFPRLAMQCPILLSKDADTGAFYAGALLGFDLGENLFLDEGKGFDGYRPLNLQRAPFFTAGEDLAIDLDSPRIAESEGQPLFDENGAPTPYLEGIMSALRELKPGAEQTRAFINTLLSLKLVEAVTVDLVFDDGTRRVLEDLYTINQNALRALPDAAVIDLFRSGYLHLVSLMIASLKLVPMLVRRKNQRLLEG